MTSKEKIDELLAVLGRIEEIVKQIIKRLKKSKDLNKNELKRIPEFFVLEQQLNDIINNLYELSLDEKEYILKE